MVRKARVVQGLNGILYILYCGFYSYRQRVYLSYFFIHCATKSTDTAMGSTVEDAYVVRKRADWMTRVDEEILETMRDEGNMTPQVLEERYDITAANYARDRMTEMARYGLVEKLGRGLYRLTDDGRAFLDEEFDASELEPVGDTPDES
jgi:hypothetical protein